MPVETEPPPTMQHLSRREVVSAVAGAGALAGVTALAGCSSGDVGTPPENTVFVGPNGMNVFRPDALTVSAGTTVTWEFKDTGHNVFAYPDAHEKVSIPDGAEPFGSVPKGEKFSTNGKGHTFEHTFETPGEYRYVCVPHASVGMVATVTVEA